MVRTTIAELLERNERHAGSLRADHFEAVQESQAPAVVSVCCSDSRVSQEGMWDIDEPGWLFTVANIGNQTWDSFGGEFVVSGDVLYPLLYTEPETAIAAVVGHTGCGAITATLEHVRGDAGDEVPSGVKQRVEWLRPVVEDGLADDRVDDGGDVNQLVEFNVDRQVSFLRESDDVPAEATVVGFVYDFQGVYGDVPGRCYLVNVDGETDVATLREQVPGEFDESVRRLL